jgi:FMNH2-dependent dimethyl sulfone monooxygenase
VKMHALGFSGATLSFVNFNDELPFFVERVLPLLRQAGLRAADEAISLQSTRRVR